MAFLPAPKPGETDVAHNDGKPDNNRVGNLRWATHVSNQMDMRTHGTMQDGERCVTAKITAADAAAIREGVANGPRGTQRRMCEKFRLSPGQVNRIVRGKRWVA
jgi:hypothetical protein